MQNNQTTLAAILMAPSNELKADRFVPENQAQDAACQTGKCMPGQCSAIYG